MWGRTTWRCRHDNSRVPASVSNRQRRRRPARVDINQNSLRVSLFRVGSFPTLSDHRETNLCGGLSFNRMADGLLVITCGPRKCRKDRPMEPPPKPMPWYNQLVFWMLGLYFLVIIVWWNMDSWRWERDCIARGGDIEDYLVLGARPQFGPIRRCRELHREGPRRPEPLYPGM